MWKYICEHCGDVVEVEVFWGFTKPCFHCHVGTGVLIGADKHVVE